MINGITMPVAALDNRGVKALIGRRVVAAKARGEDSEWPVLGIGTITSGVKDENQIRMYVQFDDDDEIGLFEDEYIVLLDERRKPDNVAAGALHDMLGDIECDTQTLEEECSIMATLVKELAEFVTEAEAEAAIAATRKEWDNINDREEAVHE